MDDEDAVTEAGCRAGGVRRLQRFSPLKMTAPQVISRAVASPRPRYRLRAAKKVGVLVPYTASSQISIICPGGKTDYNVLIMTLLNS